MTQNEFQQLVSQINEAFKDQFNRLETLEVKVKALEGKLNEQQKGSKTGASRSKRLQQAEADS
jgi:hypothetical protein